MSSASFRVVITMLYGMLATLGSWAKGVDLDCAVSQVCLQCTRVMPTCIVIWVSQGASLPVRNDDALPTASRMAGAGNSPRQSREGGGGRYGQAELGRWPHGQELASWVGLHSQWALFRVRTADNHVHGMQCTIVI